jgi:hypothetical protein
MIRKVISDLDLDFLPIPDPRVKNERILDQDPQHLYKCLKKECVTSYF